jgi:uncharacterized protein
MAKLTYLELAKKVLREEKRPLSPAEIWAVAVSKSYHESLNARQGKTPAATLYATIFVDARDNPSSSFIKLGSRPARYFLKELSTQTSQADLEKSAALEAPTPVKSASFKESQLHPFLTRFVYTQFRANCKTINHSTSTKKEFGEWVHPDVIGVFYPDWREEVRSLSQLTGGAAVKMFSFEIKKALSFANLREAFFQAVSNSSWAHEGYLVAADISDDEDFRSELRRLSTSFGIGVIQLDIDDPDSTFVYSPSRERDEVDWDALDKLSMNKDVKELLTRIKNDLSTREIRKEQYDAVKEPEDLIIMIAK